MGQQKLRAFCLRPPPWGDDLPVGDGVDEQIDLFSNVKVIGGEIGAGLTNTIFAPEGCAIIEIMPEIKHSIWIKNLSALSGFDWYCVHAGVPAERRTISVVDRVEYNYLIFSYEAPIDAILATVTQACR